MTEVIQVWMKAPGAEPEQKFIQNSLEFMQWYVGGYIEAFTLTSDMVIICNEEGKLDGLRYNCTVAGENFVGNIIIVGTDGENFADCPADEKRMRYLFPNLWENEGN